MNTVTFKGVFNWYGEMHTFFTKARSEREAKEQMIVKLAEKLGRAKQFVSYYYRQNTNAYVLEKGEHNENTENGKSVGI